MQEIELGDFIVMCVEQDVWPAVVAVQGAKAFSTEGAHAIEVVAGKHKLRFHSQRAYGKLSWVAYLGHPDTRRAIEELKEERGRPNGASKTPDADLQRPGRLHGEPLPYWKNRSLQEPTE